jgi:hypothetical protein
MGWWQTYRERQRANRTQIVERPVAAWVAHSIIFALVALILQSFRGGPINWVSPLLVGPIIAAALVLGTLLAHRREHRRSQKP